MPLRMGTCMSRSRFITREACCLRAPGQSRSARLRRAEMYLTFGSSICAELIQVGLASPPLPSSSLPPLPSSSLPPLPSSSLLFSEFRLSADKPDYDGRRPLHFAASKGKILAVSHLLGVSADPNVKDRWGHTPIDEGLLGGTRRHLKCAKLMEALGGKIGMYGRDEHEREMLERFNSIEMSEVRFLIKTLIEKGFDSMRITRTTDQQYYVAHEACVGLVPCAFEIQSLFVDVEQKLAEQVRPHQQLYDRLKSITGSCGRVIDKVNNSRLGPMDVGITAVIEMKEDGVKAKTQSFFEKLEQGIDITEFMNAVVDNDALALFEELDQIIASMEKKGRDSRQGKLMLAKEFNKALMNLNKVEDMWCELCNAFHAVAEQQNQVLLGSGYSRGVFLTYEMFPLFLEQIQLEVNHMEMRELFLSAVAPTLHNWEVQTVTPESLLCRSSKFRNIICKDCDAESSKLSTLVKSNVLRVLCFSHLKFLAWRSKTIHLGEGQKFKSDEPSMFIVKSGRVRTMFHNDGKDICLRLEYGSNTMFGEVWLLTGFAPILLIRATQKSELIQVKKSDIAVIVQVKVAASPAFFLPPHSPALRMLLANIRTGANSDRRCVISGSVGGVGL
eukprot:750824-Hanusia_phi.AAC.2